MGLSELQDASTTLNLFFSMFLSFPCTDACLAKQAETVGFTRIMHTRETPCDIVRTGGD